MKIVLLGATKGMGRALARLMATRGDELFLLGRHPGDLGDCASDLQDRGAGGEVGYAPCDLLEPAGFAAALDSATVRLGRLEAVVVTAGLYGTQEALESDRALRERVLTVGLTNTVEFCEQARVRLVKTGGGVLCVFSSVAGDRARKPVILYGAAKAGLSYYLEGLDLKFRGDGLRTVLVKPGFVRTGMTEGLKEPPFAVDAEAAALAALKAIDRGQPVVYVPRIWRLVMLGVRCVPRWLMRRSNF
jgi:short-subunit dehydrogenase